MHQHYRWKGLGKAFFWTGKIADDDEELEVVKQNEDTLSSIIIYFFTINEKYKTSRLWLPWLSSPEASPSTRLQDKQTVGWVGGVGAAILGENHVRWSW